MRKGAVSNSVLARMPAGTVKANIGGVKDTAEDVTLADFIVALIAAGLEAGGDGAIADGSVTLAKMANLAANRVIGSVAGGVPEAITVTAAGRALLDDADATAQRTTLGLGTAATSASSSFETAGAAAAVAGSLASHTGSTAGAHGISAFGATLVDDADAATARATLGAASLDDVLALQVLL